MTTQHTVLVTHTISNIDVAPPLLNRLVGSKDIQKYYNKTGNFGFISGSNYNVYSCDQNGGLLENGMFIPHPFIMCCSEAYSNHHPLILSPDDVWLLIAQGVAKHVELNSDTLRDTFISNQSESNLKQQQKTKIDINVLLDNYVDAQSTGSNILGKINWNGVVGEIIDRVDGHLKDDATQLLPCNFSTTGQVETTASKIVLMSALKNYFNFSNSFFCGLPSVTLLGTIEDWLDIRSRVVKLNKYGLEFWTRALLPIIDRFIETAKHPTDKELPVSMKEFWNKIALWSTRSGGSVITGWVKYFFPYDKRDAIARYLTQLEPNFLERKDSGVSCGEFPSGLSTVTVTLKNSPIPNVNSLEYLAGFVGYDHNGVGLKPTIGWAIASLK